MGADQDRSHRRISWWHGLLYFLAAACTQALILVVFYICSALGLLGSTPQDIAATLLSPAAVSLQVLFTSTVLVILSLGVPKLHKVSPFQWLRLHRVRPALFVVAVIGVVGVGILTDEILFLLHLAGPQLFDSAGLKMFNRIFAEASPVDYVALTLMVMVGPGLGEELFFRGFVLRSFRADLPAFLAVLFSSILFGLMHSDWLQSPGAMLIGLYLGFVALRTGSVWPGVLAHGINNLLCALFARFDSAGTSETWNEGHSMPTLIVAAAIVAGAIYALIKLTRKT